MYLETFPNIARNLLWIHWRLSMILKTSKKNAWSNAFYYVKVCIFWKCIQSTIHYDKTQMLKKFPFLSRAPTHRSLTFNLRFLYELKHLKVLVSKTVCVEFPVFDSVSFLLNFIFFFNKMDGRFDFKTSWFL